MHVWVSIANFEKIYFKSNHFNLIFMKLGIVKGILSRWTLVRECYDVQRLFNQTGWAVGHQSAAHIKNTEFCTRDHGCSFRLLCDHKSPFYHMICTSMSSVFIFLSKNVIFTYLWPHLMPYFNHPLIFTLILNFIKFKIIKRTLADYLGKYTF